LPVKSQNFSVKKLNTKKIINKNAKGFSMLEAVVSVFVLSFGIVGVMSLFVSSLKTSIDSRDTIIATELVQEGLELVRNIRDINVASGGDGVAGVTAGTTCSISYNNALACPGLTYTLNYSGTFYTYTGGSATKFQRRIETDKSVAGQVKVTSTVTWGTTAPMASPTALTCNAGNKCTFAQSILTARL